MKIELYNDVLYQLKDAVMIEFLKDDLETAEISLAQSDHPVDIKYDKKLIKAYKRILKYYGVDAEIDTKVNAGVDNG